MKVLAFDSSGAACSAAIRDGEGRLLAYRFEALARGHAQRLMPLLRDVMREAGLLAGAAGAPGAADIASRAVAGWQPGTRPALPLPLYLRPPDVTMPTAGRAPP